MKAIPDNISSWLFPELLCDLSELFRDSFTMRKVNALPYKTHKIWITSITELHVPFLWRAAVQQQIQHLHIEDTPDQLVPWWMLYQDCSMVENLRSLPPYTQQECQQQIETIMWSALKNCSIKKYIQHVKNIQGANCGSLALCCHKIFTDFT